MYTWKLLSEDEYTRECFDTVEECLDDALYEDGVELGTEVEVAECVPYQMPFSLQDLIENIIEDSLQIYDEAFEPSEDDFDALIKAPDFDEVEQQVRVTLEEFISRNAGWPGCYQCTTERRMRV